MNRSHWIVLGCFAAAFGAISYLGWALLISPVEKEIEAKLAERDDAQKKLVDAKSKAAQFDKFKAQAENIRRDLNLISQRLDPDFSMRERDRMQARFAAESSLNVGLVIVDKRAPSKETGFSNLDGINITVPFKGGFHEVGNFLNSAIAGTRVVVPTTLNFAQVAGSILTAPTIDGTVVMTLFLEQGAAPAGAPK